MAKVKVKTTTRDADQAPVCGPSTLALSLYPRAAQALLDMLENNAYPHPLPLYAVVDLDNVRNLLRAHLQHVAVDGKAVQQ